MRAGRWSDAGLVAKGVASPATSESYLRGLWTVQDEAAQLVAPLVDPGPGDEVLDACAGIGGKATHLAELMRGDLAGEAKGPLCIDRSQRKLELLREHGRRLGVRCATRCLDLSPSGSLAGQRFDRVLVDAPCTGLGVLRRHPELKWRWDAQVGERLVALQRALLTTAIGALRPGGVLVYSVCTITQEEGPEQLAWMLHRFPDLRLDPPQSGTLAELTEAGMLRLWPHRHGTDGFFLVRLRQGESRP